MFAPAPQSYSLRSMSNLLPVALLCTVFVTACGKPSETDGCGEQAIQDSAEKSTPKGTVYGEDLSDAKRMKISEIVARVDELVGQKVKVEGLVTGVCAKRGCWFNMASDTEFQSMQFKVTDGVIVFPMSAKGKYAIAEGTVQKMVLSLEQTRKFLAHKAEEASEKFDPASVTEAMTIIRLQGLGAVISDSKQP